MALATVLLVPLGIVLWALRDKTENRVWHRYFAWRPVMLTDDRTYVWFKTIERYESWLENSEYTHHYVLYREITNEN